MEDYLDIFTFEYIEFVEKFKKLNDKYDNILTRPLEDFYLYYDLFEENMAGYFYDFCVSCGDGKSFYLINYDQDGNYLDVLNYTLTHPVSKAGFGVAAEPVVDWEKKETSWIFGENQVNESEITGQYYLLQYSFYAANKETKAAWAHNMIAFKERLDALRIPYAFGLLEYNDSTFVLKLQKEDLYREIAELLGTYNPGHIHFKTKWESVDYTVQSDTFSMDPEKQSLSASFYTSSISDIKAFATQALAKGDQAAYLFCNKIPVARVPLTGLTLVDKTGAFETSDLLFDPESHFWDFMTVCLRETLEGGGTLEEISLKDESDDSFTSISVNDLPNMLESIYPDDEQIKSDMESFVTENGGEVTFADSESGVNAKFWFYDISKKSIIKDLTGFTEKLFTEFENPLSKGDIDSILIYFDTNDRESTAHERLGISFYKSTDARVMNLTNIYNQKLGLDDEKVLNEIKDAVQNSPVSKIINTAETSVYSK